MSATLVSSLFEGHRTQRPPRSPATLIEFDRVGRAPRENQTEVGIDSGRHGYTGVLMDDEGRLPIERELRLRLEALGPDARVELLRVLGLSSEERTEHVRMLFANPRSQEIAELLMDIEDDPAARGIVVTELRIMNRQDSQKHSDRHESGKN
jgi:hypothetical protein